MEISIGSIAHLECDFSIRAKPLLYKVIDLLGDVLLASTSYVNVVTVGACIVGGNCLLPWK